MAGTLGTSKAAALHNSREHHPHHRLCESCLLELCRAHPVQLYETLVTLGGILPFTVVLNDR